MLANLFDKPPNTVQALPIFLDRLVDPITAVVLSVTVVLFFGGSSAALLPSSYMGIVCIS